MKITIKYSHIGESINFLYNLSLKGKQSRHRTRFVKLLQEKLKGIAEEELEIVKEFSGVDEEGNPKKNEDDSFDIKDVKGFVAQQKELFEEEFVVEGSDHHGMLKTVKEILLNYDGEVSGQTAEVFDYLCERFEEGGED